MTWVTISIPYAPLMRPARWRLPWCSLSCARNRPFTQPPAAGPALLVFMQLLPSTARSTARRLEIGYDRKRLTSDPEYNIVLGRHYLARLLERFDNQLYLALAGYNAGPSRVDRWIEKFGDPRRGEIDPIDWIERIPFEETRNYVQRILENLRVYQAHLGEQQAALPEADTASQP